MLFKIYTIFLLLFYKFFKKKIIVINESAGFGDYLWIRNFFKLLKTDSKYSEYKIIFLGTKRWEDFARKYDSNEVDIFIFFKNPYKPKYKEIFCLKLFKFDVFINLRYKDEPWKEITGSIKADVVYNSCESGFYEDARKEFFEKIIDLPDDFSHKLPILYKPQNLPPKPFITYTPSGYYKGKINDDTGLEIIRHYIQKEIYVCVLGDKDNQKFFEYVSDNIPKEKQQYLYNGCGTFKMVELPYVINQSNLVITPDTSILHIAIQLKKRVICLYNDKISFSKYAKYINLSNCKNIIKEIEGVNK